MIYLAWLGVIVVIVAVIALITDGFQDFGAFLFLLLSIGLVVLGMIILLLSISYIHDYYFCPKPAIQLEQPK